MFQFQKLAMTAMNDKKIKLCLVRAPFPHFVLFIAAFPFFKPGQRQTQCWWAMKFSTLSPQTTFSQISGVNQILVKGENWKNLLYGAKERFVEGWRKGKSQTWHLRNCLWLINDSPHVCVRLICVLIFLLRLVQGWENEQNNVFLIFNSFTKHLLHCKKWDSSKTDVWQKRKRWFSVAQFVLILTKVVKLCHLIYILHWAKVSFQLFDKWAKNESCLQNIIGIQMLISEKKLYVTLTVIVYAKFYNDQSQEGPSVPQVTQKTI